MYSVLSFLSAHTWDISFFLSIFLCHAHLQFPLLRLTRGSLKCTSVPQSLQCIKQLNTIKKKSYSEPIDIIKGHLTAIWSFPPPPKLITSTDKCPSEFLLLLSLKGHYQRRSEHIFSAVMLQMLNLPRKWKTELIPLEEKKTNTKNNHIHILQHQPHLYSLAIPKKIADFQPVKPVMWKTKFNSFTISWIPLLLFNKRNQKIGEIYFYGNRCSFPSLLYTKHFWVLNSLRAEPTPSGPC